MGKTTKYADGREPLFNLQGKIKLQYSTSHRERN